MEAGQKKMVPHIFFFFPSHSLNTKFENKGMNMAAVNGG